MHVIVFLTENSGVSFQRISTGFFFLSTVGVTACYPPLVMIPLNVRIAAPQCFSLNSILTTNVFLWMNYMKEQCQNITVAVPHLHLVQYPPAVVNYL